MQPRSLGVTYPTQAIGASPWKSPGSLYDPALRGYANATERLRTKPYSRACQGPIWISRFLCYYWRLNTVNIIPYKLKDPAEFQKFCNY